MSELLSRAPLGRSKLILGLVLIALLLVPATSVANPPPPPVPQLDTATATGSAETPPFYGISIDAHSGPSGENPGGSVSFGGYYAFKDQQLPVGVGGPVTCLNVTGNSAVIKFNATVEIIGIHTFDPRISRIALVDNGGSGLDRFDFSYDVSSSPADCSGGAPSGQPLNGRAVVSDAQPLPTSKAQCKKGGWALFGFKSKRQCIKFVKSHR